ncbi:MAG: hypothetical protein AAF593_12505 [Planctomycetota bacterium]
MGRKHETPEELVVHQDRHGRPGSAVGQRDLQPIRLRPLKENTLAQARDFEGQIRSADHDFAQHVHHAQSAVGAGLDDPNLRAAGHHRDLLHRVGDQLVVIGMNRQAVDDLFEDVQLLELLQRCGYGVFALVGDLRRQLGDVVDMLDRVAGLGRVDGLGELIRRTGTRLHDAGLGHRAAHDMKLTP